MLLKKDLVVWRHVVTEGYYRSASFMLFMFDALLPEYHFLCSSSMGGFSSHLMILKQIRYLPGLPLSLLVGMNYGKHLSCKSGKPLIPIHHMEAHALTIRMVQKV